MGISTLGIRPKAVSTALESLERALRNRRRWETTLEDPRRRSPGIGGERDHSACDKENACFS
jgi:hypothetical protein